LRRLSRRFGAGAGGSSGSPAALGLLPERRRAPSADTILLMRIATCLLALAGSLAAQSVKEDGAYLRAGCSDSAESIAGLPQGTAIRIRYALAGAATPCYAVTAEVDGKKVQGYLSAGSLAGLEEFDAARRRASAATLPVVTKGQVEQIRESVTVSKHALAADLHRALDALEKGRAADVEPILARAGAPSGHREAAVIRGAALLQLNQPDRALGLLEGALRQHKRDHRLLALAGMASYQLDDPRSAKAYWQDSLELRADPAIEEMLRRVQREMGADKSTEKTFGSRFLLRYDGAVADPETARTLVAAMEEEFSRVASQLGCRAEEQIVAIVQSRESYRAATGAAEWNGGQFDGRIRIPVERIKQLDGATRQTLAHELVHACLATLGPWPSWVHEGLAQKLAGETLSASARDQLRALAKAGKLPKLALLGNGWSRLNAEQAHLRYAIALAAMDLLFRNQGAVAARNLLNDPENASRVASELDRALLASLP